MLWRDAFRGSFRPELSGFALSELCEIRHSEDSRKDETPCTQAHVEQAPLLKHMRGDEPPQYARNVVTAVVTENEDLIREMLVSHYSVVDRPLAIKLLRPESALIRLYEIPPSARFWWFCCQDTSY